MLKYRNLWAGIVALLVLTPVLAAGPAQAEGWSDSTLRGVADDTIGGLLGAEMDDQWIVWAQDQVPDDPSADERDVLVMNLETKVVTTIASGDSDQGAVVGVEAGVAIWTEADCGSCFVERIHGRDLDTGEEFVVAEIEHPSDLGFPVIAWHWVTWSERTADGEYLLLARNIAEMSEPVVVTRGFEEAVGGSQTPARPFGSVDAWQNWVIWLERPAPDAEPSRLVARNLFNNESKTLADTFPRQFDVSGGNVTAVDFAGDAILVVDLLTGEQSTVPIPAELGNTDSAAIETDGRTAVWQLPSGITAGLDLVTGQEFSLAVHFDRVEIDQGVLIWFVPRAWLGETEIHTSPLDAFTDGAVTRFFPETGQWLSLGFLHYWQGNGGLPVFGYPLTEETLVWDSANRPMGVQWLERQRFEWHPENAGTSYDVLLGRLGAELLERQGRDWTTFEQADPSTPHYMETTGHAVAPEFWDHWSSNGLDLGDDGVSFRESLALFGYPISEPMTETNADGDTVLTQYFERAVFEYHPDNPEPYQVLLRRLGAELRPVGIAFDP